MKDKLKKYRIFISIIILFICSCQRPPDYDKIPKIEFKSIQKSVIFSQVSLSKQDSIVVTLSFEDGDGDLGMTTDQVNKNPYVGFYERNYHATLYKRVKGVYKEVFDLEGNTLKYGGFFPPLVDKEGPIDGDLNYQILISHNNAQILEAFDTLRFEIFIIDRDLNQSNTITTGSFIYKNE